jgi:hypothetical protein
LESGNFGRSGWKTGEIIGGAANESALTGRRNGFEIVIFELSENEATVGGAGLAMGRKDQKARCSGVIT